MKAERLNEKALAISLAFVFAICTVILGILGSLGFYSGAVRMMSQFHFFFSLSFFGVILGAVESAVAGFVAGWLIAWFYNRFV